MQERTRHRSSAKTLTLVFCFVIVPLLLVLLAMMRPALADTPRHYDELTFPALPEVKLPDYTRFQLANGLVVYLMEDHELPLVSGSAFFRTGERLEPASQVGLAEITGAVMRSGGTTRRSADTLNEFLEQRAASVETGIGNVSGNAGFSTLTEDLESVFDVFVEVLQSPAFPEDKVVLAKTQIRGSIARRNDDPGEIADREFRKLVYGAESPYARIPEYTTLENVSREDLVRFHQTYFRPDAMILGVVGDFDSRKMRQLIEAKLGSWKAPAQKPRSPLPSVSQANRGVFFVNQPQLTQSTIYLGHLGNLVLSPDYPALSVMNEVLNGFGGRLFNQVRSRQGLAYSVYAVWSPQYDYPGLFTAGGQTRSDATVPFIQSVVAEINRIRSAPISESELQYAKDSVLNSFVFNFQSPDQSLARLLRYEYFGYPRDFIFQYQKAVEATTVADVLRVAKTHLKPENLVTLVVGNTAEIQPPLSQLGQVKTVDITIPAPKQG